MKDKIKIGILTFHRSINYGAFMQCYGLSKRLNKDFPEADIEVIDYVCKTVQERYSPTVFNYIIGPKHKHNSLKETVKRIAKVILYPKMMVSYKKRYKAFQSALSYLPLSDQSLISDDVALFYETYQGKYDVVIVGSDAVWEYLNYPFPNAYFMHNKIAEHCLSYAASCDRMHIATIDDVQRDYIRESLTGYAFLGVRDIATEHFVGNICPQKILFHNCDPTALLELDSMSEHKEAAKKKLIECGVDVRNPIIGVMGGRAICRFAKECFGHTHQIVSLYEYNPDADYNVTNLTPLEWANVFSFFDLTFTRFFHGFWLSLVNGVSPVVLDDWFMTDENHDSKLLDLAKRLNLLDHYFKASDLVNKRADVAARATELINTDKRDVLLAKVKKEAESYQSFYCELKEILSKSQTTPQK